MNLKCKKGVAASVQLLVCLVISNQCQAVLTDNLTIGNAKALSLGHAVTADPPGIDSIHYNPAGLARLDGRQNQYKLITGSFEVELEFGDVIDSVATFLDDKEETGNFPEGFFDDEARNTTSTTEGATLMLPFAGMTDLPVLIGPMGGASYSPPMSNMTFATSVYTPLAVGFNRAKDDPGRFIGERLSFFRLTYFAPSIAYQWDETLAVGGSILFSYSGIGLDLTFRGPHSGIVGLTEMQNWMCEQDPPLINICGSQLKLYDELGELSVAVEDPLSIGINFGVLWTPVPWLSLGVVYQSESDMDLEGEFYWDSAEVWTSLIGPITQEGFYDGANSLLSALGWSLPEGKTTQQGTAKMDMKMPEHYAFGLSLQLLPALKVNIDYKFTAWSAWPELPLEFSEPIDVLRLAEMVQPDVATRTSVSFPFGLKDSWNYALGLEYQYTDTLAFRFGYEPRDSSVPTVSETPLLPIGDGTLYGLGFEYRPDRETVVDVGIGYLETEVEMKGGESRLGNSVDPTLVIYNPYPGTDITARMNTLLVELSYQSHY